MKPVKASCGAAPFDEERTKAWRHYKAAETAYEPDINTKAKYELHAAKYTVA